MLELIGAITFPDWISDTAIPITDTWGIKWYGLSYVVGLFLAYFYARKTAENPKVWVPKRPSTDTMPVPTKALLEDFLFYSFLGIVLGGRIGYTFLYGMQGFLDDPISIFKVWQGGMSFHGGFLGVCLATILLARKSKIPLMRLADMAAISAPIGLGLVRLANFANQELLGRTTDVPWAFIFKEDGFPGPARHPSQLYEAFLEGLIILLVLYVASRKTKILTKPGTATGLFLLMYGSFRIFVEFFREPDNIPQFGALTRGMAYSLPMVVIGIAVTVWALKRAAVSPAKLENDPA